MSVKRSPLLTHALFSLTAFGVVLAVSAVSLRAEDALNPTESDDSDVSATDSLRTPAPAATAAPRAPAPVGDAPAGDLPATGSIEPDSLSTSVTDLPPSNPERFRRSRLTKDAAEGQADRRRVLMATGEDKVVDLDFDVEAGPNGIVVGNPKVAVTTLVKIGESRRQIVFKPLSSGETTVTVRDPEGGIKLIFDVTVTGNNLLRRAGEIRELLRDVEGIDIRVVGQRVVVDGEVIVPADYGRLSAILSDDAFGKTTLNLVTLSPVAMQLLAKRVQEDISTFAERVRTRVVNGMVFLEGTVDDINAARRAEEVAKLYLPEARPTSQLQDKGGNIQLLPGRKLVQNFIVVNPPPPRKQDKLVKVTVHFVELAKEYTKTFGFKWAPGFTADPQITFGQQANGENGASGTTFSAVLSSLIPKLKSGQDAGYARILKQGSVIVKSGIQGSVAENTDILIPSIGAQGQQESKPTTVGLTIKVTPTILGQSEDIQLSVDLSQRNLIGKNNNLPLISNRTVVSTLYVKSNESAAVGGFNDSEVNTDFNRDPLGAGSFEGGTEALFELKKTKSYRNKRGQFVVFVTPQIVENASEGSEDLKKSFRLKVK